MRPPARDAPWTEAQGRGMAQDQLGVRTRGPGRVSPLVRSQAGPDCVTPAAPGVADFHLPSPERRVPPDLGNRAIGEPPQSEAGHWGALHMTALRTGEEGGCSVSHGVWSLHSCRCFL